MPENTEATFAETCGLPEKLPRPLRVTQQTCAPLHNLFSRVIEQYHADRLPYALIAFVLKPKASTHAGQTVLGQAKAVSPIDNALTGLDFVIVFGWDEFQKLTDAQREALIDHELSHCTSEEVNGVTTWRTCDHDVDEFTDIIRRHGLWLPGLEKFSDAARSAAVQGDARK